MSATAEEKAPRKRTKKFPKVRCTIAIQGKMTVIKHYHLDPLPAPKSRRKEIMQFSKGSRFRLLTKIARIDWDQIPAGLFITLTYPDEHADAGVNASTMHRHHWIRHMEKYLCEKTPILWRKEAQCRKSGMYKGFFVSHFHLCVFTQKFLPHQLVREWWRKTIHAEGPLSTDVKKMSSGEHAAFYLAKYLSKRDYDASLDYAAYLTKPGRQWGFHRESMIPRCEIRVYNDIDPVVFAELMTAAGKLSIQEHPEAWESFTLLGAGSDKFAEEIRAKLG